MADKVDPRTGELVTANYGWTKPTVGASVDAWGGYLNADLDSIDGVVHGIDTRVVPAPSASLPIMDSVANAGSSAAFARGDHIHPTDTSRYAASNPANYITATTIPPASTTVLGGVKVDGTTITATGAGVISTTVVPLGDNRIINGNFAINQRAQVSGTALAAAAYGHDRWKAGASGCTYSFTQTVPDTTITITAGALTQIIEGGNIEGGVFILSWTGTAKARVYQGAATGTYVASPLITATLTAGADTTVDFNAGTLTKVKFEIGSVATPFNRQSLAKSMADCQRYYQQLGGNAASILLQGYSVNTGSTVACTVGFTAMRAAPTASTVGTFTYTNTTVGGISLVPGINTLGVQAVPVAAGYTSYQNATSGYWTLSAEL